MSISITLTESEILSRSNDFELGEYIRNKYWQERRNQEGPPPVDDVHFFLNIGDDGLVKSIGKPWTCSVCGEKTDNVDYDYLVGWDHLSCRLKEEQKSSEEYDKCVLCGKQSPYTRNTHIDMRIGYVEGGGQGCFQPNECNRL